MKKTSWISLVLIVLFAVGTVAMNGCKKQVDPAAPRSLSNDGDGEED